MTDEAGAYEPHCVVCAARGRTHRIPTGHVCAACGSRLRDHLARIPQLAALAGAAVVRSGGNGSGARTVPASRPPIDLDALDATLGLPLVLTVPGDPSSAEPILTVLWSWERAIREDRHLTPPALLTEPVTLVSVCGFLLTHADWMEAEPDFDVATLVDHVHACVRVLSRHDPDRPARRIRVTCPAPADNGECGAALRVDPLDLGAPVLCPRCREQWTADRLMLVAYSAPGATALVDPEAAAYATGVPERTLRRWAAAGAIVRQHGRYDLASIRQAVTRRGIGA